MCESEKFSRVHSVRGSMNNPSTDHPTWVYHALHEAKIVKTSEAKLLYKKGWRDSPDPKILYSGFYGKYFYLVVLLKAFFKRISPHWDSQKIFMALIAIIGIVIAIIKI